LGRHGRFTRFGSSVSVSGIKAEKQKSLVSKAIEENFSELNHWLGN
jgi:hypothetical protein